MPSEPFNPWKNFDEFDPTQFSEQSSELMQWPIKLWKAPIVSPYYHGAHLLIAADCTAFACPPAAQISSAACSARTLEPQ